jgi:hypothetical protein
VNVKACPEKQAFFVGAAASALLPVALTERAHQQFFDHHHRVFPVVYG